MLSQFKSCYDHLPREERQALMLRALLYALVGLALGYRVWLVFNFNPIDHIWSDPERHWDQGIDVLRSDPMSLIDPILYQVYIGAFAKLTLKTHELAAFYTALLSVGMTWLWYRFLRELLPSKNWALLGWALIAWSPSNSSIYSYFMQETLMLPLLGASLWATWRARRKGTLNAFLGATALWLLAGLTRGICLPLGLVALAWIWFEQGDKARRAAWGMVVMLLMLGPLTYRSFQQANIFAPHGIGSLVQAYHRSGAQEILIGYELRGARWEFGFTSPGILQKPFEPLSDWMSKRQGSVRFFVNMDAGERDWKAAVTNTPLTLDRYLWLTGDNLIHLFFAESWPDTDRSRDIGELNHWLRWLWAPLFILCATGTIWLWREQRERLLPVLLLTWFCVQGLFPLSVNEGRYRKPMEGLLIAQAVLLASTLAARRRREEVAQPAPAAPETLIVSST
ncbi:MAG: glycosyltransferase family 39 protein [Moraxellaceae bacterium]|nr:glycosyltransferase family 39 protein [Moraxellaceae bacterium]